MLRQIMAAAAAAIALSACSAHFGGTDTVPRSEVEKQAKTALNHNGTSASAVTCPSGLKAKVNATLDCTITLQGEQVPVTLRVTAIKNGKATFTVRQKQ